MKKLLLALSAVTLCAASLSAQHLSLYEEFTGEMCAPCAAANPALWTLISANPTKVMILKYQGPYAGAGPIYNQYKTIHDARALYYSNSSGPQGTLDGGTLAHPNTLTQAMINTASAVPTPFTVSIAHAWNANGDSVTATVTVAATSAFTTSGANLKLRIAIIEHMVFTTPPGSNGEKDFHNVVREMVPNATGTQMPNSWTASQSQVFTVKGRVPSIVDKTNETILVAWIQNETDKKVLQVGKSVYIPIPRDAGSTGVTPLSSLGCAPGTNTTMGSTAILKNTGTTTLTSAKIYYRADNGIYGTPVSWTGSLGPNATATVTIPPVTLSPGARAILDSVALPNGLLDVNLGNNINSGKLLVVNTAGITLPYTMNFETPSLPASWYQYDPTKSGYNWLHGVSTTGAAHNGSNNMPWFRIGDYVPSGTVCYLIMPTPKIVGATALDFWQAYAQKTAANNDKLEVVYSTNCGTSWTSLWSASGTALATYGPTTTANALPGSAVGSPDWKLRSVSLTSVPANSVLAFRGSANGGNNMFLDDVTMRTGGVGVKNMVAENSVSVYPNPARESATLEFKLAASTKVTVSVMDAVGRTVSVVSDATLQQGAQRFNIPTSSLSAGVYNIAIRTEEGLITQRLSVVK